MINFFKSLMGSGTSSLSSKRFTGIICVVSLIISLFVTLFSKGSLCPNENLVDAIALLAFGSLGLTSTEMIFGKKNDNKKENKTQDSE